MKQILEKEQELTDSRNSFCIILARIHLLLSAIWSLGHWAFGALGLWGIGPLGHWAFGALGLWGFGLWGFVLLGLALDLILYESQLHMYKEIKDKLKCREINV